MQCSFVEVRPDIWTCSNPGCEKVREVRFHNKDGKPPIRVCGRVAPPAAPKEFDPRDHERELFEALPLCKHRGRLIVRDSQCKLCGSKGELFDIYQCGLHGKCSLGKREHGLKSCLGCSDSEIDPNFPRAFAAPDPNEPLRATPTEISTVRNLIYHIWPTNHSDTWRWNVAQLLKRMDQFDGVRTIGVATGPDTATLAEVQAAFGGTRIDHWIERQNDPVLGEGATFPDMLRTLPDDNSITFYGHAKGVKYDDTNHITRRWTELLYQANLDFPTQPYEALTRFPIAGALKRYGDHVLPGNHRWHFSGTFFWFRQHDAFQHDRCYEMAKGFYGCVEAWPGQLWKANEGACLFGDQAGFLYLEDDLKQQESAMATRRAIYAAAATETPRVGVQVSDAAFMAAEINVGLTEWKWPELVGVHARGVSAMRSLGAESVFEIGSGLGPFLVAAKQAGLDARGIDINPHERDFAISKGVDPERYSLSRIDEFNLSPVDAIYCIEVFEHCTDAELEPLIKQLAANCKWFYFTSTPHATTPEADAAWGHVNLKTREQWIELLTKHGLIYRGPDKSVVEWGLLFRGMR